MRHVAYILKYFKQNLLSRRPKFYLQIYAYQNNQTHSMIQSSLASLQSTIQNPKDRIESVGPIVHFIIVSINTPNVY